MADINPPQTNELIARARSTNPIFNPSQAPELISGAVESFNSFVAENVRTKYSEWKKASEEWLDTFKRFNMEHIPICYNGTDSIVEVFMDAETIVLNTQTNLSVSSFRQKVPVRVLGLSTPAGYASGTRTIAGTIVMTCSVNHPFIKFLIPDDFDLGSTNEKFIIPDMIKPFNMRITMQSEMEERPLATVQNEFVQTNSSLRGSFMDILGVHILSDSMVVSVDDLVTEVVLQFVALAYTPLRVGFLTSRPPLSMEVKDEIVKYLRIPSNTRGSNKPTKRPATNTGGFNSRFIPEPEIAPVVVSPTLQNSSTIYKNDSGEPPGEFDQSFA